MLQQCARAIPKRFTVIWATVFALGLAGVAPAFSADLVVYSGRKEKAIKPVVDAFEAKTGISVALKVGKTAGLANTILMERARPRADIFISTVGDVMEILTNRGALAPYRSPAATHISPEFRSVSEHWTGISGRARVLIYNTQLVAKGELPQSIFDLVYPKWKGKVVIAGTQERTTVTWVTWLIQEKGRQAITKYLKQLHANGLTVLADNTNVWRGVGRGEFAIGLTNSPNYHLAIEAGLPVGVIYPDQAGIGTLVNLNAVAVVRGGPHPKTAHQFIDFILSPEGQHLLVDKAYEMPLVPGVDPGKLTPLSAVTRPSVSVSHLSELAGSTLDLLRSINPRW